MDTRIQKTLLQWFPEAFQGIEIPQSDSDYFTLRHFAQYTQSLIRENKENKKEPFKIIQLLYSKGTLYEKNAIENEFFHVLTHTEATIPIKEHMELMPEALKPIYIKTIVEN